MKERLLGFVFCAIFVAFAYNVLIDKIHARFSDVLWFQRQWIIPYVLVPLALLIALAWLMGFFRNKDTRWADLLALLSSGAIIYLMLGAGFSCWHYCF